MVPRSDSCGRADPTLNSKSTPGMDSMRSLNKSLPASSPSSRNLPPPEQLLQAFRAAALSVTTLYRTAATDQVQARQTGYQDALDDLLTFLDKENLGLDDGEGWRVRQWATERLDGTPAGQAGSESEDDRADTEKRAGSPSPVLQNKGIPPSSSQVRPPSRSNSPVRAEDLQPPAPSSSADQHVLRSRPDFAFRSAAPFPVDIDMQSTDTTSTTDSDISVHQTSTAPSSVRLEIMPRTRNLNRHSSHPGKHNTRSAASIRSLGGGAGSKRRVTFPDFFDIGSLGDGKDFGVIAPKRSRLN